MIKFMRKFFIPHKGNDYHPHFFRRASLSVLLLVTLLTGLIGVTGTIVFQQTDLLAEVRSAFLIDLANEERTEAELPTLTRNPLLTQAATLKAQHMVENGYFDHTSPEGVAPWDWFDAVGYDYAYAGENLAIHFFDSERVHEAWMNSPTHRANILQDKFTEIGIATARGEFNGHTTTFVVQMFGRPRQRALTSQAGDVSLLREVNAWVAENYIVRLAGPRTSGDKFEPGDRVRVEARYLNVRRTAGGNRIDVVELGDVGTVVNGPNFADGITWWNVDWYDPTINLVTEAEDALVRGVAISSENENLLAQAGISTFAQIENAEEEAAPIIENTVHEVKYTRAWHRFIVSPFNLSQTILIGLASLLAIALATFIGIEYKKQHTRHVLAGAFVFILILAFMTANIILSGGLQVVI